jgi:surfeit locus 1 family protein
MVICSADCRAARPGYVPRMSRPSPSRLLFPTLAAAVVIATTCSLGAWQLRRHAERNAGREEALAALDLPAVSTWEEPPLWRRVEVDGRWEGPPALVAARSRNGKPGYGVVQAFVSASGTVPVDRGWIPHDGVASSLEDMAGATPAATVHGQGRPLRGSTSEEPVPSKQAAEVDVYPPGGTASAAVAVVPGATWLVVAGEPLEPGAPEPEWPLPAGGYVAVPEDWTSWGYAVQWFGMAAVAAGMYGAWLFRALRR